MFWSRARCAVGVPEELATAVLALGPSSSLSSPLERSLQTTSLMIVMAQLLEHRWATKDVAPPYHMSTIYRIGKMYSLGAHLPKHRSIDA